MGSALPATHGPVRECQRHRHPQMKERVATHVHAVSSASAPLLMATPASRFCAMSQPSSRPRVPGPLISTPICVAPWILSRAAAVG